MNQTEKNRNKRIEENKKKEHDKTEEEYLKFRKDMLEDMHEQDSNQVWIFIILLVGILLASGIFALFR